MSAQKKRRWSPVRATAPVAALLVLVALAANGVAGCSSTADEVKEYLEVAGGVLDGIEASLAELDGLWQVPLAARGEIKENVLQFRTVIDKGKAEVDGTDAPQPCGELSGLLRQCLERGRELVNMYSHFADYIDDIAPVAQKMDELMSKMRLPKYSPILNEPKSKEYWLSQPGSPKPERPDEEPMTVPYDELIKQWKQ